MSARNIESSQPSFIRRQVHRYLRLHVGAVAQDMTAQRHWFRTIWAQTTDSAEPGHTRQPAPRDWTEAVERHSYTVPRLRRNYHSWVLQARAFLIGAGLSVPIVAHRLWLGDPGGMFASLASLLILLGFALKPAHRCWQIRTRTIGQFGYFLRRPRLWWPASARLPDGYSLYPDDSEHYRPRRPGG